MTGISKDSNAQTNGISFRAATDYMYWCITLFLAIYCI
jgi:hypothetical protein